MKPRGMALLVAVGVLSTLAVLATAFLTMSRLERQASGQRLQATRALMLARGGVEDALARLSAGQDPSSPDTRYGGENWDASEDGLLSFYEAAQEISHSTGGATEADIDTCPVPHAMRPSFFAANRLLASRPPLTVAVEGRDRGYSGRVSGDRDAWKHIYALKVEDESAKLNVNGGFLDTQDRDGDGVADHRDPDVRGSGGGPPADPRDTGRGWNAQMVRLFDLLGARPEVGVADLGKRAIDRRPPGGYASIRDLQQALGVPRDLSPYLTHRSWIDRKVVHPNGYRAQGAATTGIANRVKTDRRPLALEEEGRPPVNLNAAGRPVLLALLGDLAGKTWHDPEFPKAYAIPPAMAAAIADRLLARRRAVGPFLTWGEFAAFCDGLVDAGVIQGMDLTSNGSGGNLAAADLLKANFDPNTMLAKQLPDQLMYRWVDKSDLCVWSTEGSLGPTGTFRIGSVGRVLDAGGRLLAEATASLGVEAYGLLRHTTQEDFVAGRKPEDGARSYLSPAANPSPRTIGASAPSWKSWSGPTGLSVMTYPSPMTALPGQASALDGYVGLATTEQEPAPLAPGMPLTFLHHFDDGWDADAGGAPGRVRGAVDVLQEDLAEGIWPDAAREPNTLYPDGIHSQPSRSPAFLAAGNFPPFSGSPASNRAVVSYWVKAPKIGNPTARNKPRSHLGCLRVAVAPTTQAFQVGTDSDQIGAVIENGLNPADAGHERMSIVNYHQDAPGGVGTGQTKVVLPGLRWQLVTVSFDTNERTQIGDDVEISVREARGPGRLNDFNAYTRFAGMFDTSSNQDIQEGGTLLVIGTWPAPGIPSWVIRAGQVIDEVAIYDAGDDATEARLAAGVLREARHAAGRYYKGNDGTFLSSLLQPGPGRPDRMLKVAWTAYLPRESRPELLANFEVRGFVPALGTPRLVDPALQASRIDVALVDEAASTVLASLVQGAACHLTLSSFRYRVRFVPALTDPLNEGVLETPFFDDITFCFQPAEGPRVMAWERP